MPNPQWSRYYPFTSTALVLPWSKAQGNLLRLRLAPPGYQLWLQPRHSAAAGEASVWLVPVTEWLFLQTSWAIGIDLNESQSRNEPETPQARHGDPTWSVLSSVKQHEWKREFFSHKSTIIRLHGSRVAFSVCFSLSQGRQGPLFICTHCS